jgi:hypothetical protein
MTDDPRAAIHDYSAGRMRERSQTTCTTAWRPLLTSASARASASGTSSGSSTRRIFRCRDQRGGSPDRLPGGCDRGDLGRAFARGEMRLL